MKTRIAPLALVLAAGFAGQAFAEGPILDHGPFDPVRSRAEVTADLQAFKRAGVNPWATSYNPLKHFRSATTREAVTAGYLASRNEVKAFTGEDSGSAWLAQAREPGAPARQLAGTPRAAQ